MQVSKDKLYNVIFSRRSRRQFDGGGLSIDIIEKLQDFAKELNDNIIGARAVIVTVNPDKVFKGAVGAYGKIKGAPAYVAFIGDMKDISVQEKVGYLGEMFILRVTSVGLATCWVGGFFRPEVVQSEVGLDSDEQVLAVSPIGFAAKQYSLEEKIMTGFVASHKRTKLETMCCGDRIDSVTTWIRSALEAARLAPSAVNRQPWRFTVESGTIKVSVDNLKDSYHISKRLDCGIAMAHIEIGANHNGVTGSWEYLTGEDVARFIPT